jgi:3-oxoacyl-[acyl-carrier-protein] synthase III
MANQWRFKAMLHHNVCIESLGYELPQNVISSESIYEELAPTLERLQIPAAGLQSLTGVEERRFWDADVPLYQMAARAARKAVDSAGLALSSIGCLISTSVCKDYIEPSMASMVHGELGLSSNCLNFDLGNACLAFLNAISVVAEMIEKGQIEAGLIVDAESSRAVTEATTRRLLQDDTDAGRLREQFAALTLGSGAVAAVLTHKDLSKSQHRLIGHVAQADTRWRNLCLGQPTEMVTDHQTLLQAGVDLARRTWALACKTFDWTADSLDAFITHQVGATHHRAICEALGLDARKSFVTYPFLGNVGPASVPLTLALACDRGRVRKGDRVALMGIGSGLNCSMMEVQW